VVIVPDVKGKDRREVMANWLASKDNPYFARNLVNRVWSHFLGRGIIEEVDDIRVSNPPVNEPLLNELAMKFTVVRLRLQKARQRHLHVTDISAINTGE
jgi:hypothetical protein